IEVIGCKSPPTSGSVKVLGRSVVDSVSTSEIKTKIGFQPQLLGTSERLAVSVNLKQLVGTYDPSIDLMDLLDLKEAPEKPKPRMVNPFGLFRRKVETTSPVANDAEILLLDDPTGSLDLSIKKVVWRIVKEWQKRGKTIILATSDAQEAEQLADRIGILHQGKMIALDTPAGLLGRFGSDRAIVFRNGGDSVFGTLRRYFDNASMEGSDVVLPFERIRDLEVAFTALVGRGLEVEVAFRIPTIEDVFHRLVVPKNSSTR
ncbi:MAG TPA: hypothetical protein VEJ19_08955, partial [Nitrososphaerales archaeon]|nr:hypothetical protein [Nitrososphaerales archaeon]